MGIRRVVTWSHIPSACSFTVEHERIPQQASRHLLKAYIKLNNSWAILFIPSRGNQNKTAVKTVAELLGVSQYV